MHGIEALKAAKPGSIVTVYEELEGALDAEEYFKKLSDYGRKKNCILLESADIVTKYGEMSLGSTEPCLKAIGRGRNFEVLALNETGKKFLAAFKDKFGFAEKLGVSATKISGTVPAQKEILSESEKLRMITSMDVLRAICFALKPSGTPIKVYGGLMGVIAYDFIDQFEKLPKSKKDVLKEPDFEMNFYDHLFIVDHKNSKTIFLANALLFSREERDAEEERCMRTIEAYKRVLKVAMPAARKSTGKKMAIGTDTTKSEFIKIISGLKKNVLAGDVFQIVPSRTIISDYSAEPFDIYAALRKLNPSPYMFYFSNSSGILLGSSPETFIKIEGPEGARKRVEIRPIAGTKPRGFAPDGKIDPDLDSRFEAELKTDRKELAEHTMLIDLARNDVARVCEPGSRICEKPYMVEKYSHVQHLVSSVTGTLKYGLDALHAYLASMNMGTLSGAPKIEAMKLLRMHEKTRRGFYGGSIGYLTPSGDFDSAIVIRSMSLQKGRAYIRAGAGIVYDSVPENEFTETERKAQACLGALQLAEMRK